MLFLLCVFFTFIQLLQRFCENKSDLSAYERCSLFYHFIHVISFILLSLSLSHPPSKFVHILHNAHMCVREWYIKFSRLTDMSDKQQSKIVMFIICMLEFWQRCERKRNETHTHTKKTETNCLPNTSEISVYTDRHLWGQIFLKFFFIFNYLCFVFLIRIIYLIHSPNYGSIVVIATATVAAANDDQVFFFSGTHTHTIMYMFVCIAFIASICVTFW